MKSLYRVVAWGTATCLISLGGAPISQASPWFEAGDSYARFKLQQAADRQQLNTTITSWPLARSNAKLQPEHRKTNSALLLDELGAPTGGSVSLVSRGSSDARFIRGFEGGIREEAEVGLILSYIGDTVAVRLNPTYVDKPLDTKDVRFDGSYLAATRYNWTLGAGYIDRWWGPGWQSSLMLSNNARPIPSVWLERRNTEVSDNWLMRWMGPWHLTNFVGQLERERYVPKAKLIGMRLTFRPTFRLFNNRLEVGLSRLIQWGGEGRPNNFDSFWDSLRGNDNYGSHEDPGNQLGGIDLRYGFEWGERTVGLYTQIVGEDEAAYLPSRKVYQFGADWTSNLWRGEQQWFVEVADTLTEGMIGNNTRPNYAYEHFIYRSGLRYLGRNISTTFDADSRALSFGFHHFMGPHSKWSAVITYADLNRDGRSRFDKGRGEDIAYAVPINAQKVTVLDLSHARSLPYGQARIYLTLSSDSIQLADEELSRSIVGLEWSIHMH